MNYADLRQDLLPEFRKHFTTKREFVAFCLSVDGRTRVGGPKGKGRITAKRALALLGVPSA